MSLSKLKKYVQSFLPAKKNWQCEVEHWPEGCLSPECWGIAIGYENKIIKFWKGHRWLYYPKKNQIEWTSKQLIVEIKNKLK